MADALISPAAGGAFWAASAGLVAYSCKKVSKEADDRKIPLMGVLGAFIFTVQMLNFTIPATGSSGHLGGGMILSILLGPYAAFLVMASVLTVQALFFADGGLLALGCNIFNLGFFPCFIAYPLIYKTIAGESSGKWRITSGATLAGIVALQLGAFSVVLQTLFSGISELPFKTFVLLMQPIHLGIGIVEGAVTSAVVLFVIRIRPGILDIRMTESSDWKGIRKVILALLAAAIVSGGILSWFASSKPDGLEWSMFKTSGKEELESSEKIHGTMSSLQGKTAILPDYGFKKTEQPQEEDSNQENTARWPAVDAGTSVSGLIGGAMTLFLAGISGWALMKRRRM